MSEIPDVDSFLASCLSRPVDLADDASSFGIAVALAGTFGVAAVLPVITGDLAWGFSVLVEAAAREEAVDASDFAPGLPMLGVSQEAGAVRGETAIGVMVDELRRTAVEEE